MKMKNKSSKIFSGILSILLVLTMIVGIVPISASAVTYDVSSAVSFANNHWNDGVGLCAEFVSRCLKAGGIDVPNYSYYSTSTQSYNNNSGTLDAYNNPYTCSAALLLWLSESYTIITDPSASQIDVGDVVFMLGGSSLQWRDGHVGIVVKVENGKPYYAAHNKAQAKGSFSSSYPCTYVAKMNGSSGGTTHTHSYTDKVVDPTCTSKGYTTHTCSGCGDSYTDSYVNALGHDEGEWTTTVDAKCLTEGTEKTYCTRCGTELNSRQTDALGHDYASEVITEATCKGKGEMKYVCTRCEFTYYDVIDPKGHNHDEAIWTTTVAPTCTAKGEQTAYCPDCNELIDVRSVDALGHDEGSWVITTRPTCSDKGEETCYCTRCGKAVGKRSIAALGHDDGTWIVVTQPTCREDGQEALFCTRCGKATKKRSVDAVGHDEGVWKIDFEATANHDGQMSRYCTRCDEILETKTFEMHKHTEGYRETVIEPTCTTDGEGGIFCADCGAKFGTYSIPALKHDYNDWYTNSNGTHSHTCSRCHNFESANCDYDVTVTEATCTEAGYTTHVCKICGYTYVDGNVEALGHSWSDWTDTEDGTAHTRTCSGCGEVETVEHVWGDWVLNKDATLCKNGTKTHTCEICGTSVTVEAIHTAWLVRVPYSIILWIGNLLKKLLYIISFQWFLPSHGIPPIH